MDLRGRKARVARLKADLELVRKSISCLQKELEDVNTKRSKAYKRAYELGEKKKGLVYSCIYLFFSFQKHIYMYLYMNAKVIHKFDCFNSFRDTQTHLYDKGMLLD